MEILLSPSTQATVERIIANPPQGLLLEAPQGSGKGYLAKYLSLQLLGLGPKAQTAGKIITVMPEKGTIGIDAIRGLQADLKLKMTSDHMPNRVIIIEDIAAMTGEAQNAFLKMLEEPPVGTILLLTAVQRHQVLPTILSRVQILEIHQPTKEQIAEFYTGKVPKEQVERNYHLSGGRMGLFAALNDQNEEHPLLASITLAKTLLRQEPYDRLVQLQSVTERQDVETLLEGLSIVIRAALHGAARQRRQAELQRLNDMNALVMQLQDSLAYTPQTKLLLTHLAINM